MPDFAGYRAAHNERWVKGFYTHYPFPIARLFARRGVTPEIRQPTSEAETRRPGFSRVSLAYLVSFRGDMKYFCTSSARGPTTATASFNSSSVTPNLLAQ